MRRLLLVAALAAFPAAAQAETVSTAPGDVEWMGDFGVGHQQVVVAAAPGETNTLGVAIAADRSRVTLTDPTAPMTAQAPCTPSDAHVVVCPADEGDILRKVQADLGDGDDTFALTGPGLASVSAGPGGDTVTGGDGADALDGGPGDDQLDGGGGADAVAGGTGLDLLRGGAGDDRLTDGDAEGAVDSDAFEGGDGADTVDYSARTAAVRVALGGGPQGEAGEGDTLTGVENVVGGSGDDALTGDALDNALDGGAGDDTLTGRDGGDTLAGGAGRDALACGGADDTVRDPAETVPADCERVAFGSTFTLRARPTAVRRRAVTLRLDCPRAVPAGLPSPVPPCAGRIEVRTTGGRLLARGTIDAAPQTRNVKVVANVPRGQAPWNIVRIRTLGRSFPHVAWTARV